MLYILPLIDFVRKVHLRAFDTVLHLQGNNGIVHFDVVDEGTLNSTFVANTLLSVQVDDSARAFKPMLEI